MSIKPILFNTEMVKAILEGRKSCTRRIVKLQQFVGVLPDKRKHGLSEEFLKEKKLMFKQYCDMSDEELISASYKPPYQPGDILYVRETWRRYTKRVGDGKNCHLAEFYGYKASVANSEDANEPWHPSIHMPKEAARIWLKVTDVRVERLNDMTNDDALKEGAEGVRCDHAGLGAFGCTDCMNTGWLEPPLVEFMQIWDGTIKKSDIDRYGWNANPWVWVIEFGWCDKPESSQN